MKNYVIIGSSRGLGAALVKELLNNESHQIIGVARTKIERIENHEKWLATDRYCHIELDITSSQSRELLRSIYPEFPHEPICVIFNAALVASDVNKDGTIDYDIFDKVSQVGVNGLNNVINIFEHHFLAYGGVFVGISSFSALVPPLAEPRVAYPATKVYLDMILRCLRITWRNKVKVITVHLGHIGNSDNFSSRWEVPTYSEAARKIVRSLSGRNIPNEINCPLSYTILYKYIFALLPDRVYIWVLHLLLTLGNFVKAS